jgi:tetratricopeptide (TPR) repeat protein
MCIPIKLKRLSDITLADRARDAGEWLKASRYYEKVLGRNPHNAPILVQYGHALKETGRLELAEAAYRKAIAWGTGIPDNYVQLGHVLKLEGKFDDARTAYLVAFVLDPAGSGAARELDEIGWPTEQLARVAATAAVHGEAATPASPPASPNETAPPGPPLVAAPGIDDPFAALVVRLRVRDQVYGSPIHPQDEMCSPGREQHYYSVGLDALWNVIQSMMSAGLSDARRILDFPSGFGRVTRYLRAAFPETQIDVGDIWEAAVTHCAATYRANRIEVKPDFKDIDAPNYDVIFCGSLLTHLPEPQGERLLDFFAGHLEIGGVMIVTFCGRKNISHEMQNFNEKMFGVRDNLDRIAAIYNEGKYSFADYPGQSGYGRAFVPISWFQGYIKKNPQLVIVRMAERGWDDNQDVIALKRIF